MVRVTHPHYLVVGHIMIKYYLVLGLAITLFCGCAHRAIGYTETTGTHPYYTNVQADGKMEFGIKGDQHSIQKGRWWDIDKEYLIFVNESGNARYFKYRKVPVIMLFDMDYIFDQPFRHDTDFDKLRIREYRSGG